MAAYSGTAPTQTNAEIVTEALVRGLYDFAERGRLNHIRRLAKLLEEHKLPVTLIDPLIEVAQKDKSEAVRNAAAAVARRLFKLSTSTSA